MPYTVLETYTKTLLCLSVIVNNAYMTCCVRIYLLSPYIIYCVHVISYNYIRMFVHYISNHTPQSLNSARVQQVGRAGTIVHTWHTSQTTALCVLRLLLLCWVPIVCFPSLVTVILILTIILFDMSKISSSRPVLSDKPENTNGYLYLPVEVTWSYSDTVCMYTCVDVLYMYTHQTTLLVQHTTCTHARLHACAHTHTHTHTHWVTACSHPPALLCLLLWRCPLATAITRGSRSRQQTATEPHTHKYTVYNHEVRACTYHVCWSVSSCAYHYPYRQCVHVRMYVHMCVPLKPGQLCWPARLLWFVP